MRALVTARWHSLRIGGSATPTGTARATERVLLEEFHDAPDPGFAARGAAGEGEMVSLDRPVDREELQPLGEAARGEPRHERDADAARDELELNGEVGCLSDDVRLKAGGAAGAFDHLGAGEAVVREHPVAVRLVRQSSGSWRARARGSRLTRRHPALCVSGNAHGSV